MSIVLFLLSLIILGLGYRFYGGYLSHLVNIDPQRKTPAFTHYDGTDFVPAKNWLILFGHHFASIAGAGPIIGPVLAYFYWGWIGALLWIILGTIFIGGVHDFLSLVISIRERGESIGSVAQKYISLRSSKFLLGFLWFALVIVVAVFASLSAKSFINQPKVVVPSLGLIPLAMLVGWLIYRLKWNVFLSTILGLLGLAFLVVLGNKLPVLVPVGNPFIFWMMILFIYAFFASILPVDILLQPRDYISSFLLFFGIGVALFGLITKPLPIQGATFFKFSSPLGTLIPVMFITVACGAISGFHSLVSSGTTSKQLASETHAKRIGYGAMVLEATLALIALFCVAFGVKKRVEGVSAIGMFSLGFSKITYFLGGYGKILATVILNAFILTTLDSATRILRFITQELTKIKNKWIVTFLIVGVAYYLAATGKWQVLWPIFGASNQLVAALALIVISAWLIAKGKNYVVSLIPAIFMFLITLSSLVLGISKFYQEKNWLLLVISLILVIMSIEILLEFTKLKRR